MHHFRRTLILTRTLPEVLNKTSILLSLTLMITSCGGDSGSNVPSTNIGDTTNNPPIVSATTFSVDEDTQLQEVITATEPDGDSLTYNLISDVSNGTLVLSNNGSFTYQPANNFFGEDSFTANASDGDLSSTTVTFSIQVKPINDAPAITALSFSVDEDTQLQEVITATDPDGDSLSYNLISDVSNGTLVLANDGSFTYQPANNFYGEDSFTANASDGDLSSTTATFSIQVKPINDAPAITRISKRTRLDNEINFSLNAEDVDNDELTFSIIQLPKNGVAALNVDNTITYAPTQGSTGPDEIKVQVSDGELTATGFVEIDNNLAFKGNIIADSFDGVEVLLTGDGHLLKTTPDSLGEFKFYGLPDGDYAVKVRKGGYKSSTAIAFTLDISTINPQESTLVRGQKSRQLMSSSQSSTFGANDFLLEELDSNNFSFHWEEDQSTAGYEYAAHINEPLTIEFLDEQLIIVDDSSANQLQHDLSILLVNSGDAQWTQEHAYRIAEVMKTIPQEQRNPNKTQSLVASKWQITSNFVKDDIQITTVGEHKTVLISEAVFVNSAPKIAKIEGKRGVFYSQRLHHALVRFVTENGTNKAAYEKILTERYGVSTLIPDYFALTASTTNEDAGRFQQFHAEEIVQIINILEEMPKGMHKLPELKYLLRRLDGTPHPLHPAAPAVVWPTSGYIEFMETAFNTSNVEHMHRLIIHEKAHFLWANQFDAQLKDDWIELGGWYEDAGTDSGWATTKQTELVSAYAHLKNPNEDMAESISYFIINPDKLKSRAIKKYNFVRDRIMQGNIYLSQIREDLTFQVYNLFPDYVFPGKIKRLDIRVMGMPEEDKTVTIEIELHALDVELEGAKNAYMRIFSEVGTFKELYLYPADESGNYTRSEISTRLKGSFSLSKFAKSGFWRTQQIKITDAVGNQRMEGANDFGWKLYVNNPLEDIVKPEYVESTASLSKSVAEREGQEVQIIHATWKVNENNLMNENGPCYASMNDEMLSTYRVEEYGSYDDAIKQCTVNFVMPHYMPSSKYTMNYIKMEDLALNVRGTYFTNSDGGLRDKDIHLDEAPQEIELVTNNQDIEQPEFDLNNIQISAEPTNPDTPNGETIVTVTFKVKDNNSGYRIAHLSLRDPQGINHPFWAYNDDTYTLFPTDDVTQWHTYTRNIVLPVGSAPGTWGMTEMTIYDRAGNFKGYDFTEIVHFDVIE